MIHSWEEENLRRRICQQSYLGRRKFLINQRNMAAKLQNDSFLFDERENQSSNSEYYYRSINEINIAEVATLDMNNRLYEVGSI